MPKRLTENEILTGLKELKGWTRSENEISKTFEFKDFVHAMGFVNSVALLSEKTNHHPDIDVRWNKVTFVLSTHSAGGLTVNDFNLAKSIDNL